MALTGSQKAYLQARSNIARSGATRSNYYFAGPATITIEVGGVAQDISAYVAYNGWQVSLNLNDDVDTATLALLPTCPIVPQTRSQIVIGLGTGTNRVFAGLVLTVQRTRRPGPDPRFWYDLQCVDFMAILDAHLMVAEYPAQSASLTIVDIIQRFTRGQISTAGVAPNLPSVPGIVVINERPSTVLRRITNKIGGGFYLDPNRILHAWSSTIPSPIQEAAPQPLTDHLATLKTFQMTEDASQQRTRVWAEGQRTSTLLGVPARSWLQSGPALEIPLADAHNFDGNSSSDVHSYVRLGAQVGRGPDLQYNPTPDPSVNPPGTLVRDDAAAGAISLEVVDANVLPLVGWIQVGGQIVQFQNEFPSLGFHRLQLNPSPDYGSLQAPVSAGTQLELVPYIQHSSADRTATTPPTPPMVTSDTRPQPQGSPAVLVVMAEDATAAATIAAREDSDGFYEHLVQDGRYGHDGALSRANAELADFAAPILTYAWETEDLNAEPGRMQQIALTEGTPVTDTVRITNVVVVPVAKGSHPRRQVTATRVQTAGVVDIWVDDPR